MYGNGVRRTLHSTIQPKDIDTEGQVGSNGDIFNSVFGWLFKSLIKGVSVRALLCQ